MCVVACSICLKYSLFLLLTHFSLATPLALSCWRILTTLLISALAVRLALAKETEEVTSSILEQKLEELLPYSAITFILLLKEGSCLR